MKIEKVAEKWGQHGRDYPLANSCFSFKEVLKLTIEEMKIESIQNVGRPSPTRDLTQRKRDYY